MHSMVAIVSNTLVHLKVADRVDLKSSHHKKKSVTSVMDVNYTLVSILQYTNVFVYVYMCLCVCESLRMFSCMYLMEELRKDYGSITLSQMDFKGPLPSIAAHREKLSPPREVAPS